VRRKINERVFTEGRVGYLQEHLEHFPFNKGMANWIERHNRYSSMEAEVILEERTRSAPWKALLSRDPPTRRMASKRLFYRLPLRPALAFIYLYIFRAGFLDGIPGLYFCGLRSMYEYLISLKIREIRRRDRGLPI
jgi:hypothetical protein